MAFRNATVEISIGNVESRIRGPAPVQLLDRALNPHLPNLQVSHEGNRPTLSSVFEPHQATFLTGALPEVKRTLRRAGVRFRVRDCRRTLSRCTDWSLAGWELRDYQREVVEEAVRVGHGIIDIGTSGGKTILACAIIARLGLPALYLVTTRTLLYQTAEALERYLGVHPGIVGDGICDPKPLTVGLVQGVPLDVPFLSPWNGGTLVFDEGHHAAARTFLNLVRTVAPRHHYYLSAVPFRTGGDQVVLDALAGKSLTGRRYSAAFLVEKGYACPVEVRVIPCSISGAMHEKPFTTLYREFIAENRERNARIAQIAADEVAAGRSVLVLVERIQHGEKLQARVRAALDDLPAGPVPRDCGLVHGRLARAPLADLTRAFSEGKLPCLIATAGLFQEGVSIDGIEVLVQGGGLKSKAKVIQSVGRGMRLSPGKSACTYYDFMDDDEAGVFRAHARRRIAALKDEGFFVADRAARAAVPVVGAEARPAAPELEKEACVATAAAAASSAHPADAGAGTDASCASSILATEKGANGGATADPGHPRSDGRAWFHVPGTKRFLLVDDEGRAYATGICLQRKLVPPNACKKCGDRSVCENGGRVVWQGE
jgi:superfamily II DNA or RNA helicase